ncbi:DUF2201 family putative metallopeptidase [Mycolicibacterium llatzerense]|uniref:vWA domain-containing protein n=1 Tax=Mycolicibacterium llatzerense TaxID=280871 RepID=UPI0009F60F4B|nr:VWA-like domain-containing protein [Mycolicibacterium llatzerense]
MSAPVRALTADEWRRLRLARMAAVEAMPYFAKAVFAMVPVSAPGLGTAAVDESWRLYIDFDVFAADDGGWTMAESAGVICHEANHLIRSHAQRAKVLDAPFNHYCWNLSGDAEINDDLLAAGVGLPDGAITPSALGCDDGHAAEIYYRHLVPPGSCGLSDGDMGVGCGSGAGDTPVPGELPASVDLGNGVGLSREAADMVRTAVAQAVQEMGGAGRGTMPAGLQRWARGQLAPAVVPWQRVLRAAVRRGIEDQAGHVHHSWRRPNRRSPAGLIMPTLRAPKLTVDLIIDTSASMGQADLEAAMAETRAVLRQAGVKVRITCCDAGATTPRLVRSVGDVVLSGGGGTDLRVGVDAALAAKPRGDVLVLATDGGTPWHTAQLPVPMIVALIGAHAVDSAPRWAKTVRVTAKTEQLAAA